MKPGTIFVDVLFVILLFTFVILTGINAYDFTGETIRYAISPLGTAVYNDLGSVELQGKTAKVATFTSKVLWFADTEKIYYEPDTFMPVRVERDVSTLWGKEYIIEKYSQDDFVLTIEKFKRGKKVKEYVFKGDGPIHNAILLPFYLRAVPELDIGWSFIARFPLKFKITLVSMDEIEVSGKKTATYHFVSEPDKFEVWISKDAYRIPVKIKGKGGLDYALIMKEHFIKEEYERKD